MLTAPQLYILALVAPALIWVVNLLAVRFGVKLGRGVLTAGVYLVSFGLAFFWTPLVLPAFPVYAGDAAGFATALVTYINAFLTALGPIVALGTLAYNVLLKKVLDGSQAYVANFMAARKSGVIASKRK